MTARTLIQEREGDLEMIIISKVVGGKFNADGVLGIGRGLPTSGLKSFLSQLSDGNDQSFSIYLGK